MNNPRLNRETQYLRDKFNYRITWNDHLNGVEIRNFRYPDGWHLSNRRFWLQRDGVPPHPDNLAPLLIRIPDQYPQTRPFTFIPRGLHYTNGEVEHIIDPKETRKMSDFPSDHWMLWCVEFTGWHPSNPRSHLPAYLELMTASFTYPDKDHPLHHAVETSKS